MVASICVHVESRTTKAERNRSLIIVVVVVVVIYAGGVGIYLTQPLLIAIVQR